MAADTAKAKQKEVKSSHTCTQSNSDNLSGPLEKFHLYPKPPSEIRRKIWYLKTREIESSARWLLQNDTTTMSSHSTQARKPPVLCRTCRESRQEAMSSYEVRNFDNFISDKATHLVPYTHISIPEQISCA
jgi:hypothetical protein